MNLHSSDGPGNIPGAVSLCPLDNALSMMHTGHMTTNTNFLGCPQCRSTTLRSGGIAYEFTPSAIAPGAVAVHQIGGGLRLDPWATIQCPDDHRFRREEMVLANGHRPLMVIGADIIDHWENVHDTAEPYMAAMLVLIDLGDRFHEDGARSVVLYFLSNAATWRGPDARRIKAELRAMLAAR